METKKRLKIDVPKSDDLVTEEIPTEQDKENRNINEALKHQTLNMDIEDLADEQMDVKQMDNRDEDGNEKATRNNSSD